MEVEDDEGYGMGERRKYMNYKGMVRRILGFWERWVDEILSIFVYLEMIIWNMLECLILI